MLGYQEQLSFGSKKFYGKLVETLFQDRDVIDKKEKTVWELSKHKDAAMQKRMASINEDVHNTCARPRWRDLESPGSRSGPS